MEFAINLGLVGWLVLLLAAVVFGLALQLLGRAALRFEWLVSAAGVVLGGLVASEMIVGWQAVEPVVDGLALLPAAIGGAALGVVVAVITRALAGGRYWGELTAE